VIKRVWVLGRVALGFEGRFHHLLKNRYGQQSPALRYRPIGNGFAGELFDMLGQCDWINSTGVTWGGQRRRKPH